MTHPYPMPGLEVAMLRGRDAIFEQVIRALTQLTPAHVSIVGPRYFGKTTLMHALAARFREPESHYQVVCLWDLRHNTPHDDASFKRSLAKHLDEQLVSMGRTEFHEYLQPAGNDGPEIGGAIEDVVDSLVGEGIRILILLDDFDRLAQETQVSKNLWDYLRSLAQRVNLRFITTSRRGLRELIPSRDSLTSDFWNIFSSKVVLPPFDQRAIEQLIEPFTERVYALDDSARKELLNWTGGVPVLAAALCREIIEVLPPGAIRKAEVDRAAEAFAERGRDIIARLWDDCDQEAQGDLIDLSSASDRGNELPERRRRLLCDRGYLRLDGMRFRPACRLMNNYAGSQEGSARDLRELFRDLEAEKRTMRRLLEIKMAQVHGGSDELREFVQHAINGLNGGARAALTSIRSVAEEALGVAWDSEFPGNTITADAQRQLTLPWDQRGANISREDLAKLDNANIRRRILRLAAGAEGRIRVTKRISRPSMLLIEHLHRVGDYGQHMRDVPEGQEATVDFEFCVSACLSAIALLKRLSEDLARPEPAAA